MVSLEILLAKCLKVALWFQPGGGPSRGLLGDCKTSASEGSSTALVDMNNNPRLCRGVGHSRGAVKLLDKFLLGILPPDERLNFSSS